MTIWQQIWSTDQKLELSNEEFNQLMLARVLVGCLLGAWAIGITISDRVFNPDSLPEMMLGAVLLIGGYFAVSISAWALFVAWLEGRRNRVINPKSG